MIRHEDPVAKAFNEGENRYRQIVLGQGPLPGYPIVARETPIEHHAATCSLCGRRNEAHPVHIRDCGTSIDCDYPVPRSHNRPDSIY